MYFRSQDSMRDHASTLIPDVMYSTAFVKPWRQASFSVLLYALFGAYLAKEEMKVHAFFLFALEPVGWWRVSLVVLHDTLRVRRVCGFARASTCSRVSVARPFRVVNQ